MPEPDRVLAAHEVRRLYDHLAPGYDTLYTLARGWHPGARAIQLLGLEPGDTVIDLGCGTGVNLEGLARAVGPTGQVIGVDLSPGMLDRARRGRTAREADKVELVQADIRDYVLPPGTRAVLSTFALEMLPEYDEVVRRTCSRLAATDGRIAVAGLRQPPRWPDWAVRLGITLTRPFGVTRAYLSLRPWEAVRRHAQEVAFETRLWGTIYLSVAEVQGEHGMAPAGADPTTTR